jgi:hypothetical protein
MTLDGVSKGATSARVLGGAGTATAAPAKRNEVRRLDFMLDIV